MMEGSVYHQTHAAPSVNYYYHSHIGTPSMDHYTGMGHSNSHHTSPPPPMTFNHWKTSAPPVSAWDTPICGTANVSHHAYDGQPLHEGEPVGFSEGPVLYPPESREHYASHYPDEKQYVSRAAAEMLLSLKQINFNDEARHYGYPPHPQIDTRAEDYGPHHHHYTTQPVSVNFQMTMSCISGVAAVPAPYPRTNNLPTLPLLSRNSHHETYRRKHTSAQLARQACDYNMGSTGEKVNICTICRKSYARPSTLKTHMRTHSGEKPYTCNLCPKTFTQAANLTAHMRTHSGEKPFLCPVCDRRFSQSSSVTTHMRTHSGERPYRCRVCKKAFSDSSTLTKHIRIHSGEKPYQCQLCLLRFSQSGNLNRHMKVHMAERNGQ